VQLVWGNPERDPRDEGSSKVTREELAQIPVDREAAFINEVAMRLRDYETSNALTLPVESRVLVGNRR
jgi:hypothetical protein